MSLRTQDSQWYCRGCGRCRERSERALATFRSALAAMKPEPENPHPRWRIAVSSCMDSFRSFGDENRRSIRAGALVVGVASASIIVARSRLVRPSEACEWQFNTKIDANCH